MESESNFRMGINELLVTFRQGLIAMIPTADRAHLIWSDLNTHDDWEAIAECLFNVFVRNPIELDEGRGGGALPLPRYDFDIDTYSGHSWIQVLSVPAQQTYALLRLLTRAEAFDTVQVVEVNPESLEAGARYTFPWDDVKFILNERISGRSFRLLTEVRPLE